MAKMNKMVPSMKQLGPRPNKPTERVATTARPKTAKEPLPGKIKIRNARVTTSGGPKPKTSVSGTSMVSGTKVTKPKKPLTSSEKAFLEGQKKKAKITKKTGIYPNTAN